MVEELTRIEALQDDSVHVWTGAIGEIKKIGTIDCFVFVEM